MVASRIGLFLRVFAKLQKATITLIMSVLIMYGAETWTLRKVDEKYLESFEMWCW
jgi:hypothetical protein